MFLADGAEEATGVIECEIHAGNLSKPVLKKIPVRICVKRVSSKSYADHLLAPTTEEPFTNVR